MYDEEDGLAITPEMGFVKLVDDLNLQPNTLTFQMVTLLNLFVKPTAPFIINHGADAELFFIDRPIPKDPVVAEIDTNQCTEIQNNSED